MSAARPIRWAATIGITLMGLSVGCYFGFNHALSQSPDFYAEAVAIPASDQRQAGNEFERNVLELHNDLQDAGQWKRVFTEAQINGWLAVDLPAKFPELLPDSVSKPRIALRSRQMQIAFQYKGNNVSTVVSLNLEVRLAEATNTLAIRIRGAQAGWVPIPLKDFLDQISEAARRADILLRWAYQDGDPVALIHIPGSDDDEWFTVTAIQIEEDQLTVAGLSEGTDDD